MSHAIIQYILYLIYHEISFIMDHSGLKPLFSVTELCLSPNSRLFKIVILSNYNINVSLNIIYCSRCPHDDFVTHDELCEVVFVLR